jgi:hypothetical protein
VTLDEGWYLMSVAELEEELARLRDPSAPPSSARPIATEDALAFRAAGNVPDEQGRSLRIVLHVRSAADVRALSEKRLRFEPDFHEEASWRREGSVPVNVVPLRLGPVPPAAERNWWDEPDVAALEAGWRRDGRVEGIRVPEDYRSFVYKTVLSLRAAGRPITIDSISASLGRWLDATDVAAVRGALEDANP